MRTQSMMWTAVCGLAGLLGAGLIAGCPALEAPTDNDADIPDVVEAENFVLDATQTRTVADDLTIRSSGIVMIDGDLVVEENRGQSITIEAEGDIVVSGRIVAGNANPEAAPTAKSLRSQTTVSRIGGNVVLESKTGSIILMDTAEIRAGDGADGALNSDGMTGGAGGRGGDVIFTAPNGSLTLPNARGVIHLGNGGRGVNVALDETSIDPATLPEVFENTGGRSGVPIIDVAIIEGIEPETITLEEELIDVRNQRVGEAGDEITTFNLALDPNPFTGGVGGDAGNLSVEPLENAATAKRRNRSMENDDDPFFELDIRGANGADGWFTGGNGADARAVGSNGAQPGANGRNVSAEAGDGGTCGIAATARQVLTLMIVECTSGAGGSAFAQGGNGADGGPGKKGGSGGAAFARAGGGRIDFSTSGFICGNATAIGGEGGDGGDGCNILDAGGIGGLGGKAEASGPFGFVECDDRKSRLIATGGDGGKGGDDEGSPANGGNGGDAETEENVRDTVASQTATNGQKGANGSDCPPENDGGGGGDGDGDNTGGGDGDGNDGDNTGDGDDNNDGFEEIENTEVTPEFENAIVDPDCNIFGDGQTEVLVGSLNFTIPGNAREIRVTVTGSDPRSRVNVTARANADTGRGTTCGGAQDSNTTVHILTVENSGLAFVAFSDAAFISDSYTVKIEVLR